MHTPRLAIRALVATVVLLAAAPAGAVKAGPELTITSGTATEGSPVNIRIKADCPVRLCKFQIRTASLTAVAGEDFVQTGRSRTLKKGKDFDVKQSFATIDDAVCEKTEQFTISIQAKYADRDDLEVAKAKSTILDNDCQQPVVTPTPAPPGPTPTPTVTTAPPTTTPTPSPSPSATATYPPADTGAPTFTTTSPYNGISQTCTTPMWSGTYIAPYGFYNSGCITEKLPCPTTAQVCSVVAKSGIVLERQQYGHTVTLNSRIRANSGASEFYFHDVSCAGTGACSTQDAYTIYGGQSATSQCNGVRQSAADPNRSTVYCTLTVKKEY